MNDAIAQTELHPRARNAVVVAVLIAALAVLVACGNSSSARASQKSTAQHAQTTRRLSIGMTKKQVVRILGRPKTIRGNYWYWPVVDGKLAGKTLVAFMHGQAIVVHRADQFRILFFYGVLQNEEFRFILPSGRKEWIPINI